jgi:hypothetical protein
MDHLRNRPEINGDKKAGMMAGLEDWRRNASQEDQQHLSHLMSQAHASNRPDSKAARDDRRAAIMMGALAHPNDRSQWAEHAKTVNQSPGTADLSAHSNNALTAYDARLNNPDNIQAKKQQLQDNPKGFLEKHPFKGMGGSESPDKSYKFYAKDGVYRLDNSGGTNAPTAAHHNMENVSPLPAKGYHAVKDNVAQLPGTSTGPNSKMMATTEFSGCTYAHQKTAGGGLTAAHVDPGASADGERRSEHDRLDVRNRLNQGNAGFAGAPSNEGFKAYGPLPENARQGDYGYRQEDGKVNILGVKQGNEFKAYAQQKNPNTGALTVTEL